MIASWLIAVGLVTSGHMGSFPGTNAIGLSLVAAAKGYKCITVVPPETTREIEVTLKALGARVERSLDDRRESLRSLTRRIGNEVSPSAILDEVRFRPRGR